MSKHAVVLFVLFFLTASCVMVAKPAFSSADTAEDTWAAKAPMLQGKSGFGLTVVNGKIYAIGGYILSYVSSWNKGFSGTSKVVNTNEEYDPAVDQWILRPPMPTPRYGFATAVYENKIYCIGGVKNLLMGSGIEVRTARVEVFDLSTNKWENKTPMPTRRGGFVTMVYQDKIYCIGSGVNEVYNTATDTWQTKAAMPFNKSWTTANIVNDKLYAIYNSLLYVYDPATDTWTTKVTIPTEAYGTVSAVVDNKIYVITSNMTQIYDIETNQVSIGAGPSFGGPSSVFVTLGEMAPKRIYILYKTLQVYDPEADSWTISTKLSTDRNNYGVAVVNDKIYMIGGNTATFSGNNFVYPDITVTQHATNKEYTPFGYGTVPPKISVISPENKNYTSGNVNLTFTVNRPVLWMGYSLDGQETVTLSGNATLPELSNGLHGLTVYAKDEFENIGESETLHFSVDVPFPTALVIVPIASATAIGVGLLAYFRKRRSYSSRLNALA